MKKERLRLFGNENPFISLTHIQTRETFASLIFGPFKSAHDEPAKWLLKFITQQTRNLKS